MNTVDASLAASTKHSIVDGLERALTKLIEIPAIVALVAEVGILFTGVTARFAFNRPLTWADELASITFLWLAMLGAVLALGRGDHMRMTALVDRVAPRTRAVLESAALMAPALFLAILLHPAIDYASGQAFAETPALGLPDSVRAGAVPVGIALMLATALLRMARHASRDIAITLALLATIGAALWIAAPALKALGNWNLVVFFAILLGAAVLSGVPIAFCFGLATVAYLLTVTTAPLEVVTSRIDEGVSSLVLLAIPLFILLGHLIVMTGMATAMVGFLVSLVGHVRGGLSYVLLGAILLVSGISGAKTADMAAVAPVLFPDMKRRGIHDGELVSLLAASGAMAETIPPSIVLIIIGSVAGVSISALFTGGIVPGLVLAAALAIVAKRRMVEPEGIIRPRPSWTTIRSALITAMPALLLPVLIRTAVTEGVATATEVSTIGIAYTVLVGLFVYRRFDWRKLYPALVHTAALSGAILFIIGAATAMAWALTQSNFSHALAAMMVAVPGGKYGFLLISIAVFILLGSILEGLPAMVLFGPLLFPAAKLLGVHEVHYAMVIILAMGIGLFAPPFGLGYYAACSIGQIDPNAGLTRIWPYLGALVLGLLLVAFVPWLSIGFL
ncbi:TRAP transporter large permease subunit [Bradyrhizobium sp. SZCCHNR1070]|uniref:TRAP transporter large permease n=1 Tax=Bradyrhizobium sp. SZCCHNR1070 TaxID=3057361 RepID=UPI002916D391|nr:TRAP transporter large permease subunit [Bradyrhizobium sp. SZCCHNR1070]